ncbi:uncharacterized protein LOC119596848 [Penaeus monodon]|uniref:uncharacterized protein LOC119596848 n=1 Tax=Penaeus monodon TaxID=6687 RepID=UPI0018A6E87D|nr:uncharacterized protein LOC119596848 [Penaeus monodon]
MASIFPTSKANREGKMEAGGTTHVKQREHQARTATYTGYNLRGMPIEQLRRRTQCRGSRSSWSRGSAVHSSKRHSSEMYDSATCNVSCLESLWGAEGRTWRRRSKAVFRLVILFLSRALAA